MKEYELEHQTIIDSRLEFYRRGEAGCLFAAHAALNPDRFAWRFSVSTVEKLQIEELVQSAISLDNVSTQTILLPAVVSVNDLHDFLSVLESVDYCTLDQQRNLWERCV